MPKKYECISLNMIKTTLMSLICLYSTPGAKGLKFNTYIKIPKIQIQINIIYIQQVEPFQKYI